MFVRENWATVGYQQAIYFYYCLLIVNFDYNYNFFVYIFVNFDYNYNFFVYIFVNFIAVANLTLNQKLYNRVVPHDQTFDAPEYAGQLTFTITIRLIFFIFSEDLILF